MDDQVNDQVQAVRQDVEELKEQLTKILELLTTGRGKNVAGASSQVEIGLNQTLEEMPTYPPGFTPQMMSSPHLAGMSYPTSSPAQDPNQTLQQTTHTNNPVSTPIMESDRRVPEDHGSKRRL